MNLRLCMQALLLLWLSLTAVCVGECVPLTLLLFPCCSPSDAATVPILRRTCSLSAFQSSAPAGLEQALAGRA